MIRNVQKSDIEQLVSIENQVFPCDRLSRRRFNFWVNATHRIFIVAAQGDEVLGYVLVLLHKGTRLARLYSIAVAPQAQGQGIALQLLQCAERDAAEQERLFMRLEVAATNHGAIKLYERCGYKVFDQVQDYYENHDDALRMQKRIRIYQRNLVSTTVPWYQQTTEFTCGPSSLLMAMASLDPGMALSQEEELEIWRESTTIFMTSGHGGCHPIGLAIAARQRGFGAEVLVNTDGPLFLSSVRGDHKKSVVSLVDAQFRQKAASLGVDVIQYGAEQEQIANWLTQGFAVVILISTYRMDNRKAPHWVTVSGIDDACLYVHDPDPEDGKQDALDCQYMPIARQDFDKMSCFGQEKLRACVVIKPKP